MPQKKSSNSEVDRWVRLVGSLKNDFPHLFSWALKPDEFLELRIKVKEDGTVLAIAKGFGSDGGPVVCFGVGYDPVLAIMSIDKTIQGGNWRPDKPWSPSGK